MSQQPPDSNTAGPATPTPGKGNRRRQNKPKIDRIRSPTAVKKSSTSAEEVTGDNGPSSSDDEILFDLLGVPTPAKQNGSIPGLLPVSKSQISGSKKTDEQQGNKRGPRGGEKQTARSGGSEAKGGKGKQGHGSVSEGEVFGRNDRSRNAMPPKNELDGAMPHTADSKTSTFRPDPNVSAISAGRPKKNKAKNSTTKSKTPVSGAVETSAFDISSLSQSLPSGSHMKPPKNHTAPKGKDTEKSSRPNTDASMVWDMPEVSGPGATQELTWQQKLQGGNTSETPRRSKSSHASTHSLNQLSDRKPRSRGGHSTAAADNSHPPVSSPLVTRPAQSRRLSLDASTSVPLSAFDHTIPYHTGFNVNRAPQTPMKLPTSHNPAQELPVLQGEFPRLKRLSKGPLGNLAPNGGGGGAGNGQSGDMKYAGPTFHNSPHAASLPKPDLDDF